MDIRFLNSDQTPFGTIGMIVFNKKHWCDPHLSDNWIREYIEHIGLEEGVDWEMGKSLGTPTIIFKNEEAFIIAKMVLQNA